LNYVLLKPVLTLKPALLSNRSIVKCIKSNVILSNHLIRFDKMKDISKLDTPSAGVYLALHCRQAQQQLCASQL
jgi:hypothetical protein